MLYKLAHIIRDRYSWMWNIIEKLNSMIFYMRYGNKLNGFVCKSQPNGYDLLHLRDVKAEEIVEFFKKQPKEAFTFFHPHAFDIKCIKKMQKNKAFLGYVLIDRSNSKIAGYCFNRCFFQGIGFRGRFVDINYRGKGLGTAMNKILNEVGFGIGLRLFETVSKDNIPSYRSALSASNVRVVKEMPNNEVYLEILPS